LPALVTLLVVLVLLSNEAQSLVDTQPALTVMVGWEVAGRYSCLMLSQVLLQVLLPQVFQFGVIHCTWRQAPCWPAHKRGTRRLQQQVHRQMVSIDGSSRQDGGLLQPRGHAA
jgi:hypothetical protein